MSPHRVAASLLVALATTLQTPAVGTQDEIVARGFQDPVGVAVSAGGRIVVSDRAAGTIVEVGSNGRRTVLLRRLDAPAGIAFDEDDGLLIAEERAGRVLRRDASGAMGIVASGILRPRWIAVGTGGHLYVTERRRRIVHVTPSGEVRTVARGFRGLAGLAVSNGVLYAAARRLDTDRGRRDTEIVAFELRADGAAAGPMRTLLRDTAKEPVALAADHLGALVASVRRDSRGRDRGGVIKQSPAGEFAALASTLRSPRGVAFEPAGHLLVVEAEPVRQLRRYRAPSPPDAVVPPFTNTAPLALSGHAAPGSLVQVFADLSAGPRASAAADASSGAFTAAVPLGLNEETRFLLTATASGGRGLTSAASSHVVVHDDHLPVLSVAEPAPGIYTRADVPLRAQADDDGSGVAKVAVLWDDTVAARFENPDPDLPMEVTASLSTASLAEGPRALTVTAADRAGNGASTALLVTVDRTPPETRIVSGPAGTIAEPAATFVVEAQDVHSPVVEFAWRLDAGAWSPFGLVSTVSLTGLTPGEHRFEVKARDLAGNEDLTPAVQAFIVRSLRLSLLEPADGAVVTGGSLWLRGTVEGGAGEVAVTVPLPEGLGGMAGAPVEDGRFALEIPADPSLATLRAVATDSSGATAEASVTLIMAPDGSEVQTLSVWPPGGLAPLPVRVSVAGFVGAPVAIDFEGDGTVDFDGVPDDDSLYFTYATAGIHVPALRFTAPDGTVLTQRAVVEVYDGSRLDARLQAVWAGFRDSLRKGDVAAAVSFIAAERRGGWAEYFASLPPDAFEDVDLVFTAITLVEAGYGGAQYEMVAERDGLIYSYAVWFRLDADGRWRLWRF
ncbi:MAG: hypothetical protein FJW14_00210 [Acidimicrobiia bacterium]|nr:hypothetical protein [Acidimicrobiia bacterium]